MSHKPHTMVALSRYPHERSVTTPITLSTKRTPCPYAQNTTPNRLTATQAR